MEQLHRWVSQYGVAGLFGLLVLGIVGLPVPDETQLDFLISEARLHSVPGWMEWAEAYAGPR